MFYIRTRAAGDATWLRSVFLAYIQQIYEFIILGFARRREDCWIRQMAELTNLTNLIAEGAGGGATLYEIDQVDS